MIIKEMKQRIDGDLYYIVIAMIDGIKQKAQAKIDGDQSIARQQCLTELGI